MVLQPSILGLPCDQHLDELEIIDKNYVTLRHEVKRTKTQISQVIWLAISNRRIIIPDETTLETRPFFVLICELLRIS
jgi:hypothetical protein